MKFTGVKQFRLSPRLNQDEIPELLTFVLRYGDETENIEDQKGEIFYLFLIKTVFGFHYYIFSHCTRNTVSYRSGVGQIFDLQLDRQDPRVIEKSQN